VRAGTLAAIAAGATALAAFLRFRPFRVEVQGPSMAPTLEAGDWAIATAVRRARVGDVVVVVHPQHPDLEMVKRVRFGPGDVLPDGSTLAVDTYWVEGDDPEHSTDSRAFGPVRAAALRGRVRFVYLPAERRRFL
jgi:signal peptidase I